MTAARRPVAGLKATDLTVLDNGVAQDIQDFSIEGIPLDLSLVLDLDDIGTGPGANAPFISVPQQLRADAEEIAKDLGAHGRLRLVKVGSESAELLPLQAMPQIPAAPLDRRPNLRSYGRSGALYDVTRGPARSNHSP